MKKCKKKKKGGYSLSMSSAIRIFILSFFLFTYLTGVLCHTKEYFTYTCTTEAIIIVGKPTTICRLLQTFP